MADRGYPANDFNQFLNHGGTIAGPITATGLTSTGTVASTATTLGFYGATPVVQPVANADTSGATLVALETEVNELKQLLRDVGLLAA